VLTGEADLRDQRCARRAAAFARTHPIDTRITAVVPHFDVPFFQAGLAGYSDHAMRLTARRLGAPYCVTESMLDHSLLTSRRKRRAEHPDRVAGEDRPLAGQIVGHDAGEMAAAAALVAEMGFDVVDVNFACPSKLAKRRPRGGNLLASPAIAIEILAAVRRAVPARIPCTVKLRRAWDDTPAMALAFERIFDAAYEVGFAWATVHSRTVEQRYVGRGSWSALADLVHRYPDRLIFGSGDVDTAEDIFSMLDLCGVQAVAVARGAIANPWIFRQARELLAGHVKTGPSLAEQGGVLQEQFDQRAILLGERKASILMRKQSIHIAESHPEGADVRAAFIAAKSATEWRAVLDRWYPRS
jgi:tRNA-dihydrouridine synthase B